MQFHNCFTSLFSKKKEFKLYTIKIKTIVQTMPIIKLFFCTTCTSVKTKFCQIKKHLNCSKKNKYFD